MDIKLFDRNVPKILTRNDFFMDMVTISGQEISVSGQEIPVSGQEISVSGQEIPVSGQEIWGMAHGCFFIWDKMKKFSPQRRNPISDAPRFVYEKEIFLEREPVSVHKFSISVHKILAATLVFFSTAHGRFIVSKGCELFSANNINLQAMKNGNYQVQALWILAATILLLNVWAILNININIGGVEFKKVRLYSSIKKDPKIVVNDSINFLTSIEDSLRGKHQVKINKTMNELHPTMIIDYSHDSLRGLSAFFNALKETKKGKHKTRIAYFGDSMIEGDLLTRELREYFQKRFGGSGVGFVPITSPVAGFRQTIIHSFSEDWKASSIIKDNKQERMIGISGYVFNPLIDARITAFDSANKNAYQHSWVKYRGCPNCYNAKQFENAYLLYGSGNAKNYIGYSWGSESAHYCALDGKEELNKLELLPKDSKNIEVNFYSGEKINIYGMSFESDEGVIVDNYSFRGNSGMAFTVTPARLMKRFADILDYDLVIIHYGLNVIGSNQTDFSWYERGMKYSMKQIKQCFPKASILLIGVNDKSTKVNAEMETDIGIPILVETQKRIADTAKVCFWNLYEAMGGYNSMVRWANADTALANKDYTHLNYRGAGKVADMLFKELMKEYDGEKK